MPYTLRDNNGLTTAQLMEVAPAIFADAPMPGVSRQYTFIPTVGIINRMEEAGLVPVAVQQAPTRDPELREYPRHIVRMRYITDLGNRRPDVKEVVIGNSHNRRWPLHIFAGIFRLFCTNGLIDGSIDYGTKIAHKGDILDNVTLATVSVLSHATRLMTIVEAMKQTSMPAAGALSLAYTALYAKYGEYEPAAGYTPHQLLQRVRKEDAGTDVYTTLNVVQERALKGGITAVGTDGRSHTMRTVRDVSQIVTINDALWQQAVSYLPTF